MGIIDDIGRWGSDRFLDSKIYSSNEPERGKRVLRLIFANILAHCDDPPPLRPPRTEPPLSLFETSAHDSAAARALPPQEIQKWYDTSLFAQVYSMDWAFVENAYENKRAAQATLVLTLTQELDRRERGGGVPKSLLEGSR